MTKNNIDTPTLVTCGLPYANGELHIGHLRGFVAGDLYTRATRQAGGKAAYVSGSDVHGTPIEVAADGNPREFALSYHREFKNRLSQLSVEFDAYGHTDTEENYRTTHEFIQSLSKKGLFFEDEVEVAVDSKSNGTLLDRFVEGECPYCGENARGDECENCDRHLEPGDIVDPVSSETGQPAEYVKRKHGFIDLPQFESVIKEFISQVSCSKQAKNRTQEWIQSGLRPWCITRDISWGVPDPTNSDRVLYVWIDALSEYITATRRYSRKDCSEFGWEDIWKNKDSTIVQIIGKDIIQHHTTLWPALLSSANYCLPNALLASGFVTLEGSALSTSSGHAVWVREYVDTGLNPAYIRYYLVGTCGFENDVDFTWSKLCSTGNNRLVNTVGNFLYRTSCLGSDLELQKVEPTEEVLNEIAKRTRDYRKSVERYDIRSIANSPVEAARFGNEYLQKSEPWNKSDEKERQIVADCDHIARFVTSTLKPVSPRTASKISSGFFSGELAKVTDIPTNGEISEIEKPFQPASLPE